VEASAEWLSERERAVFTMPTIISSKSLQRAKW